MKNLNGNRNLRSLAIITSVLSMIISGAGLMAQEPVVPVVDGELGQCTADFTVRDVEENPIYDAKIEITFRHGFFGVRKMSLQVGTNSEGKARVIGLPDKSKKTFQFKVTLGGLSDTVLMNTADGCQTAFEVVLKKEETSDSDDND